MPYKTVFTTHATLLGRYLAFNDPNFYSRLPYIDWHKEAVYFNILTEAQLERAAAGAADSFTTVSRVMCGRMPPTSWSRTRPHNPERTKHQQVLFILQSRDTAPGTEKQNTPVRARTFFRLLFVRPFTHALLFHFRALRIKTKASDMTLEALARLNYKLKMIGSDMTVVMFFITNRPCHSINPDVLNSRAVMEELRKSSEGMGRM